jgi:hypothetical protein
MLQYSSFFISCGKNSSNNSSSFSPISEFYLICYVEKSIQPDRDVEAKVQDYYIVDRHYYSGNIFYNNCCYQALRP